jgi:hypothetical protein
MVEMVRRAEVGETYQWLKWLGEQRMYQERPNHIIDKHVGCNILRAFLFCKPCQRKLFEKNNCESCPPFLHTAITDAKIARTKICNKKN